MRSHRHEPLGSLERERRCRFERFEQPAMHDPDESGMMPVVRTRAALNSSLLRKVPATASVDASYACRGHTLLLQTAGPHHTIKLPRAMVACRGHALLSHTAAPHHTIKLPRATVCFPACERCMSLWLRRHVGPTLYRAFSA